MDVAEQLQTLVKLQELDHEIYSLHSTLDNEPMELEAERRTLEKLERQHSEAQENVRALQLKRNEREGELEAKEVAARKHEGQLYQVKTNKEYKALQKEIEGLRADGSVLEDDILQLLDELETIEGQVREGEAQLKQQQQVLQHKETEVQRVVADVQKQIADLESRRGVLLPAVDRTLLDNYERLVVNKQGAALAALAGESCGGCHMDLPPQKINEVQLQQQLVSCERCARILYWPEAVSSST